MANKSTCNYHQLASNVILIIFILVEFARKILNTNTLVENISHASKAIITLFLILFLIKRKSWTIFYMLLIVFALFLFGQFSIESQIRFEVLILFTRYLFPIILFCAYNHISKETKGNTFSIYKWFLLFNSLIILIGFIFQLDEFKTYSGERFGYNGLLYASATSTYVYIFYLIHLIVLVKRKIKVELWYYFPLLACFFIGTKSVYLVLLIIVPYIGYLKFKRHRFIAMSMILFLMTVILLSSINSLNRILVSNKSDFLTTILSKRDVIFKSKSLPYTEENWNFINYAFGGLGSPDLRSQMTPIDLVLIFGFLGSLFYLWVYQRIYFNFKLQKEERYLYGLIIIITFLAGNFLMYTFTQAAFLILKDNLQRIES